MERLEETGRLIYRSLSGSATPEERAALEEWLGASARNRELYERLSDEVYVAHRLGQKDSVAVRKAWSRVRGTSRRRRIVKIAGCAASILILITGVASVLIHKNHQLEQQLHAAALLSSLPGTGDVTLVLSDSTEVILGEERNIETSSVLSVDDKDGTLVYQACGDAGTGDRCDRFHTLRVARGAEYHVELSDGTRVHLNSGSSLTYPLTFGGGERRVRLDGEGYFEVARNEKSRFVVECDRFDVKVFGTRFNVSSYREDSEADVTLVSGSVSVSTPVGEYMLAPDHQIVLDESNSAMIRNVNAENIISWTHDQFYFNTERLDNILGELSRWYDVDIEYRARPDKSVRFTGFIPRYEQLGKTLEMLKMTGQIFLTVKDNKVIVEDI